MAKKFSLLLAAVAVLAFAVPSMAMAEESTAKLTEGGVLVEPGATVVGTGSDVTLTSNLLGAITCEKITLVGKVTKNKEGTVEGAGVEEKPGQTGCKNGTKAVVVTSVTLKNLFATNPTHAHASFVTKIDIGTGASEVQCTFTGENVPGTYTSGSGTLTLNSEQIVVGAPTSCGKAKLSGTFALETSNGTGLILD